jgi:hypothetical protein
VLGRAGFLVAAGAIELAAEPSLPAFLRRCPQANAERRLMADVLPMPARQIGHPISAFVLMKTDDCLLQQRSVLRVFKGGNGVTVVELK